MRICVDIDGVLFPWDEVAREVLYRRFGIVTPESDAWHAIKRNAGRAPWDWLWTPLGQDLVFSQDRAYYDAVRAVRAMLALGHEVHFVTHRNPQRTLRHTAAFLDRHFGDTRRWALHSGKVAKRHLAAWDVMVDDKPATVLEAVQAEGPMVFAPLRSWNAAELEGRDGPHLRVYTDPGDIVAWCSVREGQRILAGV